MSDDFEDEDFLLSQLTAEEIAELTDIIDPDNDLLPPSERLPLQTSKKPTGHYDRTHLLDYLKKEALASKIGDDYIPFIKQKRDEVREKQKSSKKKEKEVPVSKKGYLSEFDDMLAQLSELEMIELASELGLHGMITQSQSHGDTTDLSIPSFHREKLDRILSGKPKEEDTEPDADLLQVMESLETNDSSLNEVILNNHPLITSDTIHQLITALKTNTVVTKLSLANIKFDDGHAASLAEVLSDNRSIVTLNLDSNRLNNEGIRVIMKALIDNTTLQEIRFCNQYNKGGHRIEAEIGQYLEKNFTIKKLGYSFTCNGPRMVVEKWIMRNIDLQRQRRVYDAV